MDRRAAFLADILAHPADDAPRLIFADWLEEHGGEPERAEFIRVQCQIAAAPRNPHGNCSYCGIFSGPHRRGCTLEYPCQREEKLLDVAAAKNWTGFSTNVDEWWLKRGFVAKVKLSWEWWKVLDWHIAIHHPIENVILTTAPDDDECIARGAAVRHVNGKSVWTFKTWPGVEFEFPPYPHTNQPPEVVIRESATLGIVEPATNPWQRVTVRQENPGRAWMVICQACAPQRSARAWSEVDNPVEEITYSQVQLLSNRFADRGTVTTYWLGQCQRCRTIHWDQGAAYGQSQLQGAYGPWRAMQDALRPHL